MSDKFTLTKKDLGMHDSIMGTELLGIDIHHSQEFYDQLKAQILQDQEKAEKWDKLIESFTFDFEPIDDIEEVARQFIDEEIRTTHKLYEENKQLKEKLEKITKILSYHAIGGKPYCSFCIHSDYQNILDIINGKEILGEENE